MGDTECDEVIRVKRIIARMLAFDPAHRPSIGKVVEKLSGLRNRLGTKSLLSLDTVWETIVYSKLPEMIEFM